MPQKNKIKEKVKLEDAFSSKQKARMYLLYLAKHCEDKYDANLVRASLRLGLGLSLTEDVDWKMINKKDFIVLQIAHPMRKKEMLRLKIIKETVE
ncbi:MAG: hypothetical protein ACTSQE_07005 [Candidatus Heimdallarchaeaceae archaeon]